MEGLYDADGNFELTQARIDMFIQYYPVFNQIMEEKGDKIEDPEEDAVGTVFDEIASFDKELREAGVPNTAEFYLTMQEVLSGFMYLAAIDEMENIKKEMAETIAEMEEQLKDPNIPKSEKNAIRETIESMKGDQWKPDRPEETTDTELELIRNNYDRIAEVTGRGKKIAEIEEAEKTPAVEQ